MIWKVWYGVQPMYLSNAHIHARTHTHICFEMVVDRGGCRSEEQVICSEKLSQRRLYLKKCMWFHLGDKCTQEEDSWCFVNLLTNLSKTRSAENVRTCVVKDSWEPHGTWCRRGRWGGYLPVDCDTWNRTEGSQRERSRRYFNSRKGLDCRDLETLKWNLQRLVRVR